MKLSSAPWLAFFMQAEDGIRDRTVTGVQTCALPIFGFLSVAFVTLIPFIHVPLRYADNTILRVPGLFEFGFWLSIITGIAFLGIYSRRIATEMRSMSDALLATQMALAREQKLTDLGGVVAAAAHELG